ncbi:MAG: hypothetical protein ACJAS1_001654 [Oleiphilaceae bacterium]|jgi:hypothetical protein
MTKENQMQVVYTSIELANRSLRTIRELAVEEEGDLTLIHMLSGYTMDLLSQFRDAEGKDPIPQLAMRIERLKEVLHEISRSRGRDARQLTINLEYQDEN